jgi:hypothetical protein
MRIAPAARHPRHTARPVPRAYVRRRSRPVERQAGQEVGQLAAKQREVRAVLEALAGVEESLHLLPVIADLREEFGVGDAQAFQGESFDVLVKFFERHGIDVGSLPVSGHGRIAGID